MFTEPITSTGEDMWDRAVMALGGHGLYTGWCERQGLGRVRRPHVQGPGPVT